jgi:hypothetical protein
MGFVTESRKRPTVAPPKSFPPTHTQSALAPVVPPDRGRFASIDGCNIRCVALSSSCVRGEVM